MNRPIDVDNLVQQQHSTTSTRRRIITDSDIIQQPPIMNVDIRVKEAGQEGISEETLDYSKLN